MFSYESLNPSHTHAQDGDGLVEMRNRLVYLGSERLGGSRDDNNLQLILLNLLPICNLLVERTKVSRGAGEDQKKAENRIAK